ncbi:MAG: hypothetical protein IPH37_12725 [Burkholderiales bacterium]|nr:hypothetical protein [Burkholderiales bacterium]
MHEQAVVPPMIHLPLAAFFLLCASFMAFPVHAADYSRQILAMVANCPAMAKRDFPAATGAQVTSACACITPQMEGALKRFGTVAPTTAQWTDMGREAAQVCLEPLGKEIAIAQCVANADYRRGLKAQAGITDEQFDRYCACHMNLTFAEIKAGLDMDDPRSGKIMQEKSRQQCLEPIRTGASAQ